MNQIVFKGFLLSLCAVCSVYAVRDPNAWRLPYTNDADTFALYHLDSITHTVVDSNISGSGHYAFADDDANNPARGFYMSGKPYSWAPDPYIGPSLVPGKDPNFGNCLSFNGINQHLRYQFANFGDTFVDRSNFRVEMWAKLDRGGYARDRDNTRYILSEQNSLFSIRVVDAATDPVDNPTGGWLVSFATWQLYPSVAQDTWAIIDDASVWHHYAGEFYNGKQKLYIDGVQVVEVNAPYVVAGPPDRPMVCIGANGVEDNVERWWGKMDEVRFSMAVGVPSCGMWGYSIADFNKDCKVNFGDVREFVTQWLSTGSSNTADFNGDHTVNFKDFVKLASQWMVCTDSSVPGCVNLFR